MKTKSISEILGPCFGEGLSTESIEEWLEANENGLSPFTRGRIRSWGQELAFWRDYARIYKNLEKARPYHNLTTTVAGLIQPKANEVWLDVGCGPAKMALLAWNKSGRTIKLVVGLDIVLDPARKTQSLHPTLPMHLVFAHLGEELPFDDNHFDGIIANLVIPYATDFRSEKGIRAMREVFREMHRVLKPGGHIVWSTPRQNVHFQWVFVASLPDMLNPLPYIRNRDFSRILQGTSILRHALEIQRKGKEGTYTFLAIPQWEQLLREVGFVGPTWRVTFARQVLVNRVYKPA